MKKYTLWFVYTLMLLAVLTACNGESYIEDQGAVTDVDSNPEIKKGRCLVWLSSGALFFCGNGVTIYVDGNSVGSLSAETFNQPSCGAKNASALSLNLPYGPHTLTVSGSGEYCSNRNYSFTIEKGVCVNVKVE